MTVQIHDLSQKLGHFLDKQFKIVGYCPRCTKTLFIEKSDCQDCSFVDLHTKMVCPSCGEVGIDFNVVREK
jgi:hypothetical protein